MSSLRIKITVDVSEHSDDYFQHCQSIQDFIKPRLNTLAGDLAQNWSANFDEIIIERKVNVT